MPNFRSLVKMQFRNIKSKLKEGDRKISKIRAVNLESIMTLILIMTPWTTVMNSMIQKSKTIRKQELNQLQSPRNPN